MLQRRWPLKFTALKWKRLVFKCYTILQKKFSRNFFAPNLDKTHKWKFFFQIQLSTYFYPSWRRMTWRTIQTPWKSSKGNQNKNPHPTTANSYTHSLTIVSSRSGIGFFLGAPQFLLFFVLVLFVFSALFSFSKN